MTQGFNARKREEEIAALTSKVLRLRCALADIEALAETLEEAKQMASAALEAKSST
jgi:hypothetical protein